MSGLPPAKECSDWPNRPAFLCAHPKIHTKEYGPEDVLPLGIPIEFESDLFKGKIFVRLRHIEPHYDDKVNHEAYFDGKKRLWQVTVQGKFKEQLNMNDIMIGDFYDKPMIVPRGKLIGAGVKAYQKFYAVHYPTYILDILSDKPKILAPFGNAQIMRIDLPGNEPDFTSVIDGLQEDTSLLLGEKFAASSSMLKRRKYLENPKNASKYDVNPEHVYTFELYDRTLCFGTYYQYVMGIKLDVVKFMNHQPLAYGLHTRDKRVIYKFPIWNERLIKDMNK